MGVILVTGAGGNVGAPLIQTLAQRGESVRAAFRRPRGQSPAGVQEVPFDFLDPATYPAALEGVDRLFLMRPPALSDIPRQIVPFLQAARQTGLGQTGLGQTVLLSLEGAETREYLPHRKMEHALEELGLPHTILRPSFFMQNLATAHRQEIREQGRLIIPAGRGLINFIDTRDIARAAAVTLTQTGHLGRAYTLTGPENLGYDQIAGKMTRILGRPITYPRPGFLRFYLHRRRLGDARLYTVVMIFLYGQTRLGRRPVTAPHLEQLLAADGGVPRSFEDFLEDYREVWD